MNTFILMSVFFRLWVKFYVNPDLTSHKTEKRKDKNQKQNHWLPKASCSHLQSVYDIYFDSFFGF